MKMRHLTWLLFLLLLAGCEEPFSEPGTWHAVGLDQSNIDAQAIDKADTVAGHGQSGSDGVLDTAAVIRLYDDKTKPLKIESTTAGGGS